MANSTESAVRHGSRTASIVLGCLTVALTTLAPQRAFAQAQPVFDMHTLAPGVFAAEVVRNPPAYAFANSLIVVGADGVLVVDTQQSLTAARSLIAEIARLTSAPVRWVVNTHWHADHVNGNQAYVEAFPGVQFISQATLPEDLRTRWLAWKTQELAQLPPSIENRRRWLESGIGPDGAALTEAARASITRSLALREAYLEELKIIQPPVPTSVFDDSLVLVVGEHRVLLLHAGPAHTRGDILVELPALRLIAVGDLLEAGMPYFEHASPWGWFRALGRMKAADPAVILPGHGSVQRDQQLLDDTWALLELVVKAAAPDAPKPELEGGGLSPGWADLQRRWADRYGVSAAGFREGIATAIDRARAERGVSHGASRLPLSAAAGMPGCIAARR